MWGYGLALSRRFGCKAYPAAAGLLLALDYEVREPTARPAHGRALPAQ
jgi:hypothetical protein